MPAGRAGLTVPFVLAALLFLPAGAVAQAVCSAPHSAPVVTPSGSIAMLEPGTGWLQATLHRVRSTEFFGAAGAAQPFLGDGRATTLSAFLTGAVGVAPGLELWIQLPVHSLRFIDASGDRERTGFGDPRASARLGAEILGLRDVPVWARAGIKLPGSDFPVDARVLPLTEGQIDYELALESGWSFRALPVYVLGWVGYRWRTEDASTRRMPGDERFIHVAVGGSAAGVRLELALEALDGLTPIQDGLAIPASARRLLQLNPAIGWQMGSGRLELAGQIPLSGHNLPTGPGVSVAYLVNWSMY